MKKFVSLLLAVLMTAALFTGCAKQPQAPDQPQEEAVTIRVGGLKGPTSMGLVKLLDDAENQKTANAIDFRMAASANELTPLLLQGELDILAVPANLGSVLYNKTEGQVKMLAVSTLGVLYMVEKGGETVTDIKSLAGKTIYATGKGATPEYALTYLLARNGLELGKDVNVEWKSEPTEIVAQMAAMDNAVAMLPQPFVVVAMGQVEGLRVALDLTEQWNALGGDSQLITAVLLVRSEFLDQHPQNQAQAEAAADAQQAEGHRREKVRLLPDRPQPLGHLPGGRQQQVHAHRHGRPLPDRQGQGHRYALLQARVLHSVLRCIYFPIQ